MPDYPPLPPRPKLRTLPPLSTEGVYGEEAPVRLTDPAGTLTGRYEPAVIRSLNRAATQHGVDPVTAMSVGLQESALGKHNPVNPLGVFESGANMLDDPEVSTVGLTNPAGAEALARDKNIDRGVEILSQKMRQHEGEGEERQLQAYNGLGTPTFNRPAYGVANARDLPPNFYGKRIVDIRERMRPALEGLTRATR